MEGKVAVPGLDVAPGLVGFRHEADGHHVARLLTEGPAEILAHVAPNLLPLAEAVESAFNGDHFHAPGVLRRLYRFQLRLRSPDVHQGGVGELLPCEDAEVGVEDAVAKGQ